VNSISDITVISVYGRFGSVRSYDDEVIFQRADELQWKMIQLMKVEELKDGIWIIIFTDNWTTVNALKIEE
jgi:hypothetical protein